LFTKDVGELEYGQIGIDLHNYDEFDLDEVYCAQIGLGLHIFSELNLHEKYCVQNSTELTQLRRIWSRRKKSVLKLNCAYTFSTN